MSAEISRKEACPCRTDVLNQLYDRYQLCPDDQKAIAELFEEVHNFATRVVSKQRALNGWKSLRSSADDVIQTAVVKVWKGLKTFRSESKFSTWCHRVIQTTAIDAIRNMPRGEVELLSWKGYAAEYCGTAHGGCTGAAPDSGKAHDAFAQRLLESAPKQNDDSDGDGFGVRPLLTKRYLSQQEDRLNADIDLRTKLNDLNPDDRQIAELFFVSGYEAVEIAEKLGKNTTRIGRKLSSGERWVQNRIAAIRKSFNADGPFHAHNIGRALLETDESYVSRIELEHELELTVRLALIAPSRNPDGEADPFADRVLDASSNSGLEDQQNRERAA
jgi:RNA polymerase sigma factor (sigma-70 family)